MAGYSAKVVEPYAEALMAVAQSHDLVDAFGDDLKALRQLLDESSDLASFLSNPLVSPADQKAVLGRLLGDNANAYLQKFLFLLVDRRRIVLLGAVCDRYVELLRRFKNIVLAEVTAAVPLGGDQEARIVDRVKQLTGAASVELNVRIDADLIGGVVIKVGSQVLDASLRGQLRRLSYSLVR